MGDGAAAGSRQEPTVLHVDMDAFFASVEMLDDPTLGGTPVIVGGSGARGVVASCNYEARAFGVHSAMPSVRARQLCPRAVFVDGHYSRYAEVSAQLREVLESFSPLVEPIGLDEAFLDVRGALRLLGPPAAIGMRIRQRVRDELGLDCSVGAGRSKMVAKLASQAAKPTASPEGKRPGRGVVVVTQEEEGSFLRPMAVERLWGVGPAAAKRLHDIGVRTVADLAALPEGVLVHALGRAHGAHLAALARGEDPDPVVPRRPAKSVGHEETFGQDVFDRDALGAHALRMSESVAANLRAGGQAARTVTVKVKFADFSLVTRAHTLSLGVDTGSAIAAIASALLGAIELQAGVRLLGVSASSLQPAATASQLRFDLVAPPSDLGAGQMAAAERRQEEWREVMASVDAIRERFGTASVGTASMVGPHGIVVPARREAPWGPKAEDAREERRPSEGRRERRPSEGRRT